MMIETVLGISRTNFTWDFMVYTFYNTTKLLSYTKIIS